MVVQYSTYVVGIAVPFGILASGMKYVGPVGGIKIIDKFI